MDDLATVRTQEYEKVFSELIDTAERLDKLRRLEGGGVDPHATAAMHALRFAATILWPTIPSAPPPGFRHDSERLLQLAAHWREAALELGEFAPAPPCGSSPTRHHPRRGGADPINLLVTSRTAG